MSKFKELYDALKTEELTEQEMMQLVEWLVNEIQKRRES
jgi:hypothetical protein